MPIWTGPPCASEPLWGRWRYSTWTTLRRGFCPRCGTHLVSVADGSGRSMVTTFSLTEQSSGLEPVGHSFRQRAVPWMTLALAPDPLHL